MIRNALYSIFLHLALFFLIYLSLNFKKFAVENNVKEHPKVVVNFAVKIGNTNAVFNASKPQTGMEQPKKEDVQKEDVKTPTTTPNKEQKTPEKKKKSAKKASNPKPAKPKVEAKPKVAEKIAEKKVAKIPDKEKIIQKEQPKEEKKEEVKPVINKEEKPEAEENENEEEEVGKEEEDSDSPGPRDLQTIDLSSRERFNIQSQIKRCYRRAIGNNENDSRVPVNIHIVIEKDGTIDLDKAVIQDIEKYEDPKDVDFHIAVDNVKQALSFCSPIRNLPEDKYDVWKEVDLRFDDDLNKDN